MWLLIACLAMGLGILAGVSVVEIRHLPTTMTLLLIPLGATVMYWFVDDVEKLAKEKDVSSIRVLVVALASTSFVAALLKTLGDDNESTIFFTAFVFPGAMITATDLRWLIGIPTMALVATGVVAFNSGIHAIESHLSDIAKFAIFLGFYFPISYLVRYKTKFLR